MSNLYSNNFAISTFISEADLVVKLVIIILFLASFCSWSIIFDKFIKFKILSKRAKKFNAEYWSGVELMPFYERLKDSDNHPFSHLLITAINEWQLHDEKDLKDNYKKERLKERIFQSMMIARNRAVNRLEKNINFLAIISSASPFIGLFGTVWGIMNSFVAIVDAKNVSLAVVAPGIAEALFATAIGLFAAIPALIFYNIYVNHLDLYNAKLEDFSTEMLNLLSRQMDKK
ncbi:MAG: protein TolQ [Rickettsiales bacterium]|nr:protein TolQ [Rickettsiales bacterium]